MGSVRVPKKVKLISGLIYKDEDSAEKAKRCLEKVFGGVDFEAGPFDFIHTSYYSKEFGTGLKRRFFGFKKLIHPDKAFAAKLKTNALEKRFVKNGKRTVNIDPGYIDLGKLVLFSTKDYSHRIYMARGIYAEVTLHYKDGCFTAWPWTYPDYKSTEYLETFKAVRAIYKEKIS